MANAANVGTIKVDSTIVPKLREWIDAGRGVRAWENQDLSSGNVGRLTFTPADVTTSPHWSLVDRGPVDPASIIVETFSPRLEFSGMAKRRYWGMDVSDSTRAKADRLKVEGESWYYTIERDYGRTFVKVSIGRMVESSFIG